MRGRNLTYQAESVDVVYSTWTEHLGSHDYLSMNEKLLIKYEYMYPCRGTVKILLGKDLISSTDVFSELMVYIFLRRLL